MRRAIMNLGVCIFILISFFVRNQAQSLTEVKVEKSATGGANDPCYICAKDKGQTISIKVKPNHFPFKISDIQIQNASLPGMDINFSGSTNITYFRIKKGSYRGVPILHSNQVISANSSLLDSNGNLTIVFGYNARFCLQSTFSNSYLEFKLNIDVGIDDLIKQKSTGISTPGYTLLRSNRLGTLFATGIGLNCDGSLPYYVNPDLTPPSPSPTPGPNQQKTSFEENRFTFNLYPNPIKSKLLFNFEISENTPVNVKMFNSSGQLVLEDLKSENYSSGSHTLKYDLTLINSGIYVFQVLIGNRIFSKKIIKL